MSRPGAGGTPAAAAAPRARRPGEDEAAEQLARAVRAVDAPDVVFALSRDGRRTVVCGGARPAPPCGREHLRYEIGSATKVFTGLLLARLAQQGLVGPNDTAAHLLTRSGPRPGGGTGAGVRQVTLNHLITHTSGLPRLPRDFYLHALPHWSSQPYAGYDAARLVAAFLRSRPPRPPGTRWRYSNFGVSVLGHALGAATATPWDELLARQVLRPLGLHGTRLRAEGRSPDDRGPAAAPASGPVTPSAPASPPPSAAAPLSAPAPLSASPAGRDAIGYRADGRTPVPALDAAAFGPAGALRSTPADLLTFLEAHARPAGSPLEQALRAVQRPVLRHGARHPEEHTLTWFRHPAPAGAFYFHAGATSGQQAFLAFQPATGTALAAVSTRRFRSGDALVPTAYALLADPAGRDCG